MPLKPTWEHEIRKHTKKHYSNDICPTSSHWLNKAPDLFKIFKQDRADVCFAIKQFIILLDLYVIIYSKNKQMLIKF